MPRESRCGEYGLRRVPELLLFCFAQKVQVENTPIVRRLLFREDPSEQGCCFARERKLHLNLAALSD